MTHWTPLLRRPTCNDTLHTSNPSICDESETVAALFWPFGRTRRVPDPSCRERRADGHPEGTKEEGSDITAAVSTPEALLKLLKNLREAATWALPSAELVQRGMRNAIYDAVALPLVSRSEDRRLVLPRAIRDLADHESSIRREVLRQEGILIVATALRNSPEITNTSLGEILRMELDEEWKPSSAKRYANGIRRYFEWALETGDVIPRLRFQIGDKIMGA